MIEIKPLSPQDWMIYRDLRLEALKSDPKAFGSSFEEESQYTQDNWIKYTNNVYFAMTDGRAVGMIVPYFNTKMKYQHIAEIFSFYVNSAYRGQGIGKRLMAHALTIISENKKITKVKLTVNVEQQAVRLYEKFGFKCVGKMNKEMLVDGIFYDEYMMEKLF